MKNILYCTVLIAMASLMTGCSLDETPKSSFSEEKAYSTPDLVYLNTVANLYNKLHSRFHGGDDNYSYMSELTADVLFRPGRQGDWVDGGKHQNAFLHKWDKSTDYLKNLWNDSYSDIALCNAAIAKLVEIRDSLKTIPAEDINPMIAEVRGIRAFYYMWLVDFYGRIPLVTSPGVGIGDVKQEDRKTAYDFVKKELCEILPVLPDKPSQTKGDYYSRITRPVVYAMIARFAINGAVFIQNEWYNGQFTGGIKKVEDGVTKAGVADIWNIPEVKDPMNAWETVIYCQTMLKLSGYSLETDFASNFKIGNESSCENIFVEPMDDDIYRTSDSQISLSINYQHASALGFNSSNGTCATTHAIKVFGYIEKYETVSQGSDEAVPGAFEKESGYFDTDPYDYRFDVSFFYGPCKVQDSIRVKSGVSAEKWPYGCYLGYAARNDYSAEDYSSDWGKYVVKWGGLRIRKYEYDPTTSEASIFNADRVIYRYGDMLLLAAEAQHRLGDDDAALILLNEIRLRAGLEPLTTIDLQTILDEKLKEEIWETMGRRGDLIRCGLYTEPDEDKYEGVKHAPAASDWTYDDKGITCVFPIPADVISLNKNLTQNVGY